MQLNERLKEIRLGKNLTQQEFADMTGISKRSQVDYEKGDAFPNAKYLMALHNAGYDVKYLLTGKHETTSLNPKQQQLIQCYQDASPEFREGAFDFFMVEQLQSPKADNDRVRGNVLELLTGSRNANGEVVDVPFYSVEASAGNGAFIDTERKPTHYKPVARKWLRDKQYQLENLKGLVARGDSMTPKIEDGDEIIINTADKEVLDGKIYVIRMGDRLWVKKTQWLPNDGLRLIAENKAYEPMDWSSSDLANEDIEIIGKVVRVESDFI